MEERLWVYVQQQSRALSQWLVREYLEPLEANKEFLLTGCCCFNVCLSVSFFFFWFRFPRAFTDSMGNGLCQGPVSRLAQSSGLIVIYTARAVQVYS